MVTKQEQVEYLAGVWKSWPPLYLRRAVTMSSSVLGEFCPTRTRGAGVYKITRDEWQNERDKLTIKPKTIKVNGFDVPEPIKGSLPDIYYMPCLSSVDLYSWADNIAGNVDNIRWRRGICHSTKEAAVAHAKALLGIDPNKE